MFASLGLFKDVPCPLGTDCVLVNCIFRHQTANNATNSEPTDAPPAVAEGLSPPPQKKRRIDSDMKIERPARISQLGNGSDQQRSGTSQIESEFRSRPLKHLSTKDTRLASTNSGPKEPSHKATSASARKPVSPPPLRRAGRPHSMVAKESLNPRTIPNPPRRHAERK